MIDTFRFPEPWKHLSEIKENLSDETILFLLEGIKAENVEHLKNHLTNVIEEREKTKDVKYAKNRKDGLYCYISLIITAVFCAFSLEFSAFISLGSFLVLTGMFVVWPFSIIRAHFKKKDFPPSEAPVPFPAKGWTEIYLVVSLMLGLATLLLHYDL